MIQTGEYDYAWNMQVEDEILLKLENSRSPRGRVEFVPSGNTEHIRLNGGDPWPEVNDEHSSAKTKHPLLADPAVRRALSLLVDRASVEAHIFGRGGTATGNFVNAPERFVSKNTQRRQGDLEARTRWHPRQGWQATETRVSDLDQMPRVGKPRQSSSRDARRRASKWNSIGDGLGLFLLRRGEP